MAALVAIAGLVALVALVAACGEAGAGGGDDAPLDGDAGVACSPVDGFPTYADFDLIARDVLPAEVNAATGWLDPDEAHGVYVGKDRPTRPELLVVLGDRGARADELRWLGRVAAYAGYRVIVLAYPGDHDVAALCAEPGAAASCAEDARSEIVYGRDAHDGVRLDAENAAVPRLEALLAHLAAAEPQLGFGDFVPAGGAGGAAGLDWSRVALVGVGSGGAHVGLIARDHAVARTVYLGAAADDAVWAAAPRATPPVAERALGHEAAPEFAALEATALAWGLDAFGPARRVDGGAAPPYGCTHVLTTGAAVAPAPCTATASLAADECLARAAGAGPEDPPALTPAWLYLLVAEPEAQ